MVNNKQVIHVPNSLVLFQKEQDRSLKLTFMWTEAVFGVVVKVVGGGAPQEAVITAL